LQVANLADELLADLVRLLAEWRQSTCSLHCWKLAEFELLVLPPVDRLLSPRDAVQ